MQISPPFELVISLCIFLQHMLNEIDLPININSYFIIILQETSLGLPYLIEAFKHCYQQLLHASWFVLTPLILLCLHFQGDFLISS
jgi:hypothetical protein